MKVYLTIIKKEILDAIRDGKSLATALLMPITLALVSFGSLQFLLSLQKGTQEIRLPVQGAQHIGPLISYLEEQGVKIIDAPSDPEEAIRNRQFDMVLIVTEDFSEKFRAQKTADISLLSDHARSESQPKVARIKRLVTQWSVSTGSLRLIARNVSPGIANPINLISVNVTSQQRSASRILAGLPMFILMIAFASGIGMISDMASGERERKSLEPLLINPISHNVIFLGKWMAAVIVTFGITLIGILLQFLSINSSPLAELGLRMDMGIDEFFVILLIVIPVILFAVALQLFISLFAKSFKDAQSYNSLIVMLPMAPGLYLTLNSGSAEMWQMYVPVLGPTALFVDIVGGDGASVVHIVVSSAISLICAMACIFAGIALLKREKTIFG